MSVLLPAPCSDIHCEQLLFGPSPVHLLDQMTADLGQTRSPLPGTRIRQHSAGILIGSGCLGTQNANVITTFEFLVLARYLLRNKFVYICRTAKPTACQLLTGTLRPDASVHVRSVLRVTPTSKSNGKYVSPSSYANLMNR
ncbi:hypothetical protein C8R45DRAFT_942275 [Mycena sanguinolenta]|nr:hypothetical protein C8R45DRAFT_942275 [Mycena sanguinolenta]